MGLVRGLEGVGLMPDAGYQLKRPCRNCPFSTVETRIKFSCRERAEEIAETAYRQGFPCHLSAAYEEETDYRPGGFVFGEKTQHCAGAIMMFLADDHDCWPGINNDDGLADRLRERMDWTAPHFESEEAFLEANP